MRAKLARAEVGLGFNLDSTIVTSPLTDTPASAGTVETPASPAKGETTMFRTSVLFPRSVHDKLRAIAFEERCTVTDLINEGLDHVLTSRNYPTTGELRHKEA